MLHYIHFPLILYVCVCMSALVVQLSMSKDGKFYIINQKCYWEL